MSFHLGNLTKKTPDDSIYSSLYSTIEVDTPGGENGSDRK